MTKSKTCVTVAAIGAAVSLLAMSSWSPSPAVAGGRVAAAKLGSRTRLTASLQWSLVSLPLYRLTSAMLMQSLVKAGRSHKQGG